MEGLVGEGWLMYVDPDGLGWSIFYPPDWSIVANTSEKNAAFESPGGGQLIVLHAPTPDENTVSSVTFLASQLGAAADDAIEESLDDVLNLLFEQLEVSECRENAACRSWFVDINYENEILFLADGQDIPGVELNVLIDPWNYEPIASASDRKSWWYGYYDPQATQNVAYLLFTYDHDERLESVVDDMVKSFEPPDGYPHLNR